MGWEYLERAGWSSASPWDWSAGTEQRHLLLVQLELLWVLSCDWSLSLSLSLCPRLLAPHSGLLQDLQLQFPCELVVALNGRVWVKASSVQQTLLVANLLQSCDTMSGQQRRQLLRRVAQGAL